jgi:hypothetical protein
MIEPTYTEFEQGERQALLQVRSFIAQHGTKEVSDYAAQRLHDLKMDALRRQPIEEGEPIELIVTVSRASKPRWFLRYDVAGEQMEDHADVGEPITVPTGAKIIEAGPVQYASGSVRAATVQAK